MLKNIHIQNKALWAGIMLMGLVAAFSFARAYNGSAPQIVAESGSTIVINNYYGSSQDASGLEGTLGTTPVASNASHLSQEPKPTAFGSTYFSGDVEYDGSAYFDSPATFASNTRAASFVRTGSIAAFTATSTATALQVCDSPVWTTTPVSTTPTLTLPTTSSLFAACLSSNGDSISFGLVNLSSATNTILAAGTGGTLNWSLNSSTINAGTDSTINIKRVSDISYQATVTVHPN